MLESSGQIAADVHANDPPPPLSKDRKVASRLSRFDDAEAVAVTGDLDLFDVFTRELDKHAAVRPALVDLTG